MRKLTHYLKSTLPVAFGYTGRAPLRCLKGDGSDRKVYRVKVGPKTSILVDHPGGRKGVPSENSAFYYIDRHMASRGIHTPAIIDFDWRLGIFLLEDFGDVTLEDWINKKNIYLITTYKEILKLLVGIQVEGSRGFDPRQCYDTPVYDGLFSWERETEYFFRFFVRGQMGREKIDSGTMVEFKEIALRVDQEKMRFFLYRDFQSRNIMVLPDDFGFIDFQGGRLGPPQYDLASLLIDPYVGLSRSVQEKLIIFYLQELSKKTVVQAADFMTHYRIIGFQRNLQILGAFSFLSQVKGKLHFDRSLPPAVRNLKRWVGFPEFNPYRRLRKFVAEL
jgi:N-acetylmuramate 1-kinase